MLWVCAQVANREVQEKQAVISDTFFEKKIRQIKNKYIITTEETICLLSLLRTPKKILEPIEAFVWLISYFSAQSIDVLMLMYD